MQTDSARKRIHSLQTMLALSAGLLSAAGCQSARLDIARKQFYAGHPESAVVELETTDIQDNDRVLVMMERGMMRQAAGDHEGATADWLDAAARSEKLDYISVSQQTGSLTVNEQLLAYRGPPYEQVLVHAFAAQSFLSLGQIDDAAVEARRAIQKLESRGKYPDTAFVRYLAGACLAAAGDDPGAAVQYRIASELSAVVDIDPGTGMPAPEGQTLPPRQAGTPVVVIIGIGRSSAAPGAWRNDRWGGNPHAVIESRGRPLGRTYTLSALPVLQEETRRVTEAKRAARTATRIAFKETVSHAVRNENEALGEFLRVLLYALETPDRRQWVTLPRWLQAGCVRLPEPAESITVRGMGRGSLAEARDVPLTPPGRSGIRFAFVRFY